MGDLMEQVKEEFKMDMTPMIDVVFLLIIFFLCIDFKILEAKLPAFLPKDKGSQEFKVDPMEQLSVKIVCESFGTKLPRNRGFDPNAINPNTGRANPFWLKDHRIHWEVGAKKVSDLQRLREELTKIANDETTWQRDKDTGKLKKLPVVVEPATETVYDDVAKTVDAVKAAGFEEVNFGGGMGGKAAGTGR